MDCAQAMREVPRGLRNPGLPSPFVHSLHPRQRAVIVKCVSLAPDPLRSVYSAYGLAMGTFQDLVMLGAASVGTGDSHSASRDEITTSSPLAHATARGL